jgi:hypothetical protein
MMGGKAAAKAIAAMRATGDFSAASCAQYERAWKGEFGHDFPLSTAFAHIIYRWVLCWVGGAGRGGGREEGHRGTDHIIYRLVLVGGRELGRGKTGALTISSTGGCFVVGGGGVWLGGGGTGRKQGNQGH